MTKLSKNKQFVSKLISDFNNDTETSLMFVKDFIYCRTDIDYGKWAPQVSSVYKNANVILKKYNLKVCKGSRPLFCTLEPLFKKREKIIILEEDTDFLDIK